MISTPAASRNRFLLPLFVCAAAVVAVALPALASTLRLDAQAAMRAAELLEDEDAGGLAVRSAFFLQQAGEGLQLGRLQVQVASADVLGPLRLSLVIELDEGASTIRHLEVAPEGAVLTFFYDSPLELSDAAKEVVVVVEELETETWGGAVAEITDEPMAAASGSGRLSAAQVWSAVPAPQPTTSPSAAPSSVSSASAAAAPPRPSRGTVVRLLPPRGRKIQGNTALDTLVSSPLVTRVDFFVDGQKQASSSKKPFSARVPIAGPGHEQILEVVAYDGTGGELGRDEITVNEQLRRFRVRLAALEAQPDGSYAVEAEVTLPVRGQLERVEIALSGERLARLREPPYRATIPAGKATVQDYVQAIAYLADGSSVEDVVLLADQGINDTLDVNLVELFVVVTDSDGKPVRGLGKEDFEVRQQRRRQTVERLSFAEDVPLVLGLVLDTSSSMHFMMNDTKRAATQFLYQTVKEDDRVFLASFDDLPRLLHPATGQLEQIFGSFDRLLPQGNTALYDAMLFSLAEFSGGRGRKALVVLTDGIDSQSEFGPNRVIRYGRATGVPIYIIGLGGREFLGASKVFEIASIAEETGGRIYFPTSTDELRQVYAEINEELRSQYLLTYYTDRELNAQIQRSIEVKVAGRGREARAVVSPD